MKVTRTPTHIQSRTFVKIKSIYIKCLESNRLIVHIQMVTAVFISAAPAVAATVLYQKPLVNIIFKDKNYKDSY